MKNQRPIGPQPPTDAAWETHVQTLARHLPYPPTPDIAAQISTHTRYPHAVPSILPDLRRPIWAALILITLLLGLFAVPPVRAAILEYLQLGAVRIWLVEPTPSPTTATSSTATSSTVTSPTATPPSTPAPILRRALFNLAGATTLEAAATKAGFPIRLPTTPPTLGLPDGVFYQDMNGPTVILLWLDDATPDQAAHSLHIFGSGTIVTKGNPPVVAETTVNGNPAIWTEGPYMLRYGEEGATHWETRYLVSGRVLIWEQDGLTYRLESDLSMDEAIEMAESLE